MLGFSTKFRLPSLLARSQRISPKPKQDHHKTSSLARRRSQLEQLERRNLLAGDTFDLGPIHLGIQVADNATGIGYIMYSSEQVATRFAANPPHARNSDHLIAVRFQNETWEYNPNASQWQAFDPEPNDRLLAAVDYDLDLISGLEGSSGQLNGIDLGYVTGDLAFFENTWRGRYNKGEFTVTGTSFQAETARAVSIGSVNRGLQVQDAATGTGYLMYSAENVKVRFATNPPHRQSSDHIIAVRYRDGDWQYGAEHQWHNFDPASGDRLLALVDYSRDTTTSLEGQSGEVFGIDQGYASGDLAYFADQWNGEPNNGEFTVAGTYFQTSTEPVVALGRINHGIQVADNADGHGYIMHSFQNLFTRFADNPPHHRNSDHLIAVRFRNDSWQYGDSFHWHNFQPSEHDRLVASVDYRSDTIYSLEGATGKVHGVPQGFASGDLTFAADVWRNRFNNGEFTVRGTSFVANDKTEFDLGAVDRGIQLDDKATGTGYIMHSHLDVATRFAENPPHQRNSENLVAVRYRNNTWQYASEFQWHEFVPLGNDRLIAEVSFSQDTITSLAGVSGSVFGIQRGFVSGDLEFFADQWNGKPNNGEFTVSGTYFSDADPSNDPNSGAVRFDLLGVGNLGNAPDATVRKGGASGFGQVNYNYAIAKTPVTNRQYVQFLNSIASVSDPHEVYDPSMQFNTQGGILRSGIEGNYFYSLHAGWANRPVNFVDVYDAMRFANWLYNGQPIGLQGPDTTEDGAYTITQTGIDLHNITRNPGSGFFLPTENEWYKAAFHEPGASGNDYWSYPTRSDVLPSPGQLRPNGDLVAGPNIANYNSGGILANVGTAGPQSESYYGVADMAGHVWEWTETIITPEEFSNPPESNPPSNGTWRAIMGGSRSAKTEHLRSTFRHPEDPFDADCCRGIRIVYVPPPAV